MSTPQDRFDPMPPMPSAEPAGPPDRPRSVDLAFILVLSSLAFNLITAAVSVLGGHDLIRDMVADALKQSGQPSGAADVDRMMQGLLVPALLGGLIVIGVMVLFAVKMRAGRNWARIVLTVLAAFNVLSFLASAGAIGLGLDSLLNAVSAALSVATLVYLHRGESTVYFRAMRARVRR